MAQKDKTVWIVGANFENKGAQSMLFITVDELKRLFPDYKIFFAGGNMPEPEKYTFGHVFYTRATKKIALSKGIPVGTVMLCFIKDCVKFVIGRRRNLWRFMETRRLLPDVDLIIDVSGFGLGDQWTVEQQELYLDNIRLAKKQQIPIFLMPQSFGPFERQDREQLTAETRKLLQYPKIAFARENAGYKWLHEEFGLQNVMMSTDLVLQNKGVDEKNIFKRKVEFHLPQIQRQDVVGIVPNRQCFRHGDEKKNRELYRAIIEKLLSSGKRVYVFRHSQEDLDICKQIKDDFCNEERVELLTNDFSCLEYDEFVRNFEFIICSRYHGIVHAYRNHVPCIALGWAVKYRELAGNVGQENYVFDITEEGSIEEGVIAALSRMLRDYEKESEVIREQVWNIQTENCFRYLATEE